MKLAITGKGGVGKTTMAGLLARLYAAGGRPVIAIDANPDANLASSLGIPPEAAREIRPIAELKELIEERTGAKPGAPGGYFSLTPRVDDIPERFSAKKDGIQLLVMGTVKTGGSGCMCPESALIRNLLSHIIIGRPDVVIMDMDAGVEHLGRGTAGSVDAFIVVVEPGRRSIQTAEAVKSLAKDLGIEKCYAVGNKVRNEADRQFIVDNLPGFELLGFLNYNASIAEADRLGVSAYDLDSKVVEEVRAIKEKLEQISSLK
ncbi:MAG: carbon monoxide dehydrogenase accessory protein CooC [Chloroflexota bacterium]